MSASQDEIPPPPPPPPLSSQTPTQQTPHTVSTIKLSILKKGEYDIGAMKNGALIWPIQTIDSGGYTKLIGPVSSLQIHQDNLRLCPPRTAEEIVAKKGGKREKSKEHIAYGPTRRSTLAKFHKMNDAKATVEGFSVSNTEGLHKGYEQVPKSSELVRDSWSRRRDAWNSGNKDGSRTGQKEDSKALVTINGEGVDWTNHSKDEDYALIACNNSDSDTEREQLSDASIEIKRAYSQGLKELVEHSYVASSTRTTLNLSKLLNTQMSANDKFGLGYGDHRYDGILSYENEVLQSVFMNKESEIENQPLYDSLNHLIRDCDFHEKRMARKADLNNGWNNVQRVNKQNQFVPSAVLTRTGKIPVNTAKASSTKNFSTARQSFNRQTVLTSTAMKVNTVKPIVNRVRPANVFYKTHSPSSRPFKKTTVLRTKFSNQKLNTAKDYPHRALKNKGIVDSGCSRHMTGNKAYLAEFQDFNGGPVAFGGSKGYITGKGKIKTGKLDFEDFKLPDENQVLLKIPRQNNMYSFNLENIVLSGFLACLIAKATTDESNKWHRRFSWVFFLRTKDETSAILKDFIRQIENQLNQKVKTIRCDNGTEFKNKDVIEFCGSKRIKREYSNARTLQQNGVAERKNMTLIEAARTMLADSFLPNTF
ncbi:ribonuclease H-like domain-containing protein [Tanacetum coccineum]